MRSDAGFVIAADSALADNDGNVVPIPGCKVFTTKNTIAWGYGGLMGGDGFDPTSVLRGAIDTSELDILKARIPSTIIPLLVKQARQIRVAAPTKFQFFLEGNDIFEVFVATQQRALMQGYRVTMDSGKNVSVVLTGTLDCQAGSPTCSAGRIMEIGIAAEIKKYATTHKGEACRSLSYSDCAEFLVGLEVAAYPNLVRPPVDVVEISAGGIVWKKRKPACDTVKSRTIQGHRTIH
jgi:hypothetical protein